MSAVHEVRWRLLIERIEALTDVLSRDEQRDLPEVEEQAVRLVAAAALLLNQHAVNKKGQCKFCGWTRRVRRMWRKRPRCTVYQVFSRTLDHELAVVWWELFEAVGDQVSLAEVRAWLTDRARS